jgi:lysophospholipase L1-like esterase
MILPLRVAFLGDSITEFWKPRRPDFWPEHFLNFGISGQTSAQMLSRLGEVLESSPDYLHILAGTNDVAGNGGDVSNEYIIDNIATIVQGARTGGVQIMVGSIPPTGYPEWNDRITALNAALNEIASVGFFVDYHAALLGADGLCDKNLLPDGIHPEELGYARMEQTVRCSVPILFN